MDSVAVASHSSNEVTQGIFEDMELEQSTTAPQAEPSTLQNQNVELIAVMSSKNWNEASHGTIDSLPDNHEGMEEVMEEDRSTTPHLAGPSTPQNQTMEPVSVISSYSSIETSKEPVMDLTIREMEEKMELDPSALADFSCSVECSPKFLVDQVGSSVEMANPWLIIEGEIDRKKKMSFT